MYFRRLRTITIYSQTLIGGQPVFGCNFAPFLCVRRQLALALCFRLAALRCALKQVT
jgi:hypothetical protein